MKGNKVVSNDRRTNDLMRSDNDRRSSDDRRSHRKMPKSAFKDSNGVTATRDRRRAPDRRLNNIHVEWIEEDDSA